MFNSKRAEQFHKYREARQYFIEHPEIFISLERYLSSVVFELIKSNIVEFHADYNEASLLFPFWQNYPPEERGRKPVGDQYPWIEVGEHVFGNKLVRLIGTRFTICDAGLPSGPDKRMIITSNAIGSICNQYTDSCWLFLDVKSVGPRDDQPHAVMSHNQISGDGIWDQEEAGVKNKPILAKGSRASHPFYCAIPPLYILSGGMSVPVINIVVKPVYKMLSLGQISSDQGQPLLKVSVITIPNGLLLSENPNYLKTFPMLFFPGKDDKGKDVRKVRARVSFELLQKIDSWRVRTIEIS